MPNIDRHYLRIQIKLRFFESLGTAYQDFFEKVMEASEPSFQKIAPYGPKGDGGNDGYIKKEGHYFQVHAPRDPSLKRSSIAKKFKEDFEKVHAKWSTIGPVKQYSFVFNDQFEGSIKDFEETISEIEQDHPDVDFNLLLSKQLERIILDLPNEELQLLGFNTDSSDFESLQNSLIEMIEQNLDKSNCEAADHCISLLETISNTTQDSDLAIKTILLRATLLTKQEKIDEAISILEEICSEDSEDERPLARLAELKLKIRQTEGAESSIARAKQINANSPFVKATELIFGIENDEFAEPPEDLDQVLLFSERENSILCRLYAACALYRGDLDLAQNLSDKSLELNADRIDNHIFSLQIKVAIKQDIEEIKATKTAARKILEKADEIEEKFGGRLSISSRHRCYIDLARSSAHQALNNISRQEEISSGILTEACKCYLDSSVEGILLDRLRAGYFSPYALEKLTKYLSGGDFPLSPEINKIMICQEAFSGADSDRIKQFLLSTNDKHSLELIECIENEDYEKATNLIGDDLEFGISLIQSYKSTPAFSKYLIDNLDLEEVAKKKLLIGYYHSIGDTEKAIDVIRNLDLSAIAPPEFEAFLRVFHKVGAYDYELELLNRNLELQHGTDALTTKYRLFYLYIHVMRFDMSVTLGKEILQEISNDPGYDLEFKRSIFYNTLVSCVNRSSIDKSVLHTATELIDSYCEGWGNYELLIGPVPGVFYLLGEYKSLVSSIRKAVEIRKSLCTHDLVRLYYVFTVELREKVDFQKFMLESIDSSAFVKFEGDQGWYNFTDEEFPSTSTVPEESSVYTEAIGKKPGELVEFSNQYSPDPIIKKIEKIASIEGWIFWHVVDEFHKLAAANLLPKVVNFTVPETDGQTDFSNMIRVMEDLSKPGAELFEDYVKKSLPLALLATTEGGITHALERIRGENRGYINFSTGSVEEFTTQVDIASKIISEGHSFLLDGTAAFFLADSGRLLDFVETFPEVKVPASVLEFLVRLVSMLESRYHASGTVSLLNGQISYREIDQDLIAQTKESISQAIKLIESRPDTVRYLSEAGKADTPIEKSIKGEYCDATLLARKLKIPVLTDDYSYPVATSKILGLEEVPYFSTVSLIRAQYKLNRLRFTDYLDYFEYCSHNRFRFLSIHPDDIQKAIFGDQLITEVNTKNIEKLNLRFTLAEEYGVTLSESLRVVSTFLSQLLLDQSVPPDIVGKIFLQLSLVIPTNNLKRSMLASLIELCRKSTEGFFKNSTIFVDRTKYDEKLQLLRETASIYS